MKRTYKAIKKSVIFVVGVFVMIVGLILIPLPGPGLLVVALGLVILSREFEWAEKHLNKVKKMMNDVIEKAKKRADKFRDE